ncbi:MAG: leucine-rich repeat protein [Clostridia bacterium]|nr:leucine-rich repeat protein [Clostridia bacterium]
MKRIAILLVALSLVVSGVFLLNSCKNDSGEAEGSEGGLNFSLSPDGSYEVDAGDIKDDDSVKEVVIPSTFEDTAVTQVPDGAFKDCVYLEKIEISDGVKSIGKNAFEGCTALKEIVIPESVTEIGEYAFWNCSSLTEVKIPSGVTVIEKYTFWRCSELESVSLPSGLLKLGDRVFADCTALVSAEVPAGVTWMGGGSFAGCTALGTLTIPFVGNELDGTQNTYFGHIFGAQSSTHNATSVPKSLETLIITGGKRIEKDAFMGCSSLKSISLPDTIESVSTDVFADCKNLAFNIEGGAKYLGNEKNKYLCLYELQSKDVTAVTVSSLTKVICDGVFSGYEFLEKVVLPEGLTDIGKSAFLNCKKLSEVNIPSTVESIGEGAFNGCASLLEVVLPEGVTTVGDYAFGGCTSLASVSLPESLTEIGNFAFNGCSSLDSLTIPSAVKLIGVWCFQNCTALKNVSFGNPSGWTAGITPVAATELTDTATAAKHLTETYFSSRWQQN